MGLEGHAGASDYRKTSPHVCLRELKKRRPIRSHPTWGFHPFGRRSRGITEMAVFPALARLPLPEFRAVVSVRWA